MSDRLKDLHRQRVLVQEQLAWLEREIARETGAAPVPPPAPSPVVSPVSPTGPAVDADADKIMAQYRPEHSIRDQVKQGCMVYLFAAFGLVGLGILLLYLFHHRP